MSLEPQRFLVGNIRGLPGIDGTNGFSPIVEVAEDTVDADHGTYILDITSKTGTIRTPNLVGRQGFTGQNGRHGLGVLIFGEFDTLEELEAAHPIGTAGQTYLVGTRAFIWDVNQNIWVPTIISRGKNDLIDPFIMWVDGNENLYIASYSDVPDFLYKDVPGDLIVYLGAWTEYPFRYDNETGNFYFQTQTYRSQLLKKGN